MKRILSWIVLWVCTFISAYLIKLITYLAVTFASRLYDTSRGIFWVVIICGGSFGIGAAYFISVFASSLCVTASEKIKPSLTNRRYKVCAIIIGILFLLDLILCILLGGTGSYLASQVIGDLLVIVFCLLLFAYAKKETNED